MISRRALLPLAALLLTLAPVCREASDPVIAVHLVTLSEKTTAAKLDRLDAAFDELLGTQDGVLGSEVFADAVAGKEVVVVGRGASREAAEDTGLALDGSAAEKALAAFGTVQPTRFFRRLRSRDYARGDAGYTEVVVFRTRPGATRADHLKLFDAAEDGFANEGGVVGHALGLSAEGRWIHLVHWKSAKDFERSSKALMRHAGVRGWITSLDFQRFQQRHGAPR